MNVSMGLCGIDCARALRDVIREEWLPDAGPAQIAEAVAAGFGFNTHRALIARFRPDDVPEFLEFDSDRFAARLAEMGHRFPGGHAVRCLHAAAGTVRKEAWPEPGPDRSVGLGETGLGSDAADVLRGWLRDGVGGILLTGDPDACRKLLAAAETEAVRHGELLHAFSAIDPATESDIHSGRPHPRLTVRHVKVATPEGMRHASFARDLGWPAAARRMATGARLHGEQPWGFVEAQGPEEAFRAFVRHLGRAGGVHLMAWDVRIAGIEVGQDGALRTSVLEIPAGEVRARLMAAYGHDVIGEAEEDAARIAALARARSGTAGPR